MDPERMAVVAGWTDTKSALSRWRADHFRVVGGWFVLSFGVGVALMFATWAVAVLLPDDQGIAFVSLAGDGTLTDVLEIIRRNLLVLAMHSLVCVAGYMATSTMPMAATAYSGWARKMHEIAGPVAIVFVTIATIASLALQAYALGSAAPGIATAVDRSVAGLLLLVTPHALPELAAIFLPLGAWLLIARRRQQPDLLAASILATTAALPVVIAASFIEVYVTPHILTTSLLT